MAEQTIGAVIIGRNEGERLVRCLKSVAPQVSDIIYVDSGSKDGSVFVARAAGAQVVELDLNEPFTAARARNAGFAELMANRTCHYVQFIDGDCELQPDWVRASVEFLVSNPRAAVACGRRRERSPDASVYNRICDREWDTPIGRTLACGGDALVRSSALSAVGGFNPALIAGEEPELCVRLRAAGWEVWRLDREMVLHDAAMTRLGQWWNRARRAGHAFAEGAALHGSAPERHGVRETVRALVWGAGLPVATVLGAFAFPWALMSALAYPAQIVRLAAREGWRSREAWEAAFFFTFGKFPEVLGVFEYVFGRLSRRPSDLIEYK